MSKQQESVILLYFFKHALPERHPCLQNSSLFSTSLKGAREEEAVLIMRSKKDESAMISLTIPYFCSHTRGSS